MARRAMYECDSCGATAEGVRTPNGDHTLPRGWLKLELRCHPDEPGPLLTDKFDVCGVKCATQRLVFLRSLTTSKVGP
jgi:hypothetical protein